MITKLKEKYELWGLMINKCKTNYLCIGLEVADLNLSPKEENIKSCQIGSRRRGKQSTKVLNRLL